jgi:hypothetical protein
MSIGINRKQKLFKDILFLIWLPKAPVPAFYLIQPVVPVPLLRPVISRLVGIPLHVPGFAELILYTLVDVPVNIIPYKH